MRIRILTQNPFSVGFGGLEQQASKYIDLIKSLDPSIDIGFFRWDEKSFDVLHIIGIHGGINPYWIDSLKAKGVRIFVSSVFYIKPNGLFDYRRPLFYKLSSLIPFHVINWMKQLLQKADIILPNSQEEGMQLQSIFGLSREKISVLYNGVDANYFVGVDEKRFQQEYNISDYILCVSHIEPRKNHLSLIKGFLRYKKLEKNNEKLVLFGDYRGNYFGYHEKVKYLINKYQDIIIHITHLKNTDPIFKSAYLGAKSHFLLSSLETPGLSNLEAGIAGIQLILGDCKPVREYFGNYAHYINGRKKGQIVNSLRQVNKEKNQKQIYFIKNNYSWHRIGKELLSYYYKIGMKG